MTPTADGGTPQPERLKVTVSDAVTGEELGSQVIYDDYLLICAGLPYLAHTQLYANGTHVLTIKDCGQKGSDQ